MDDLLDKLFNLHYISTNSTSYRNLFSRSTNQVHLSRYFDDLPTFLSSQTRQYVDDLNNENEKLGSFRDCKYTISSLPLSLTQPMKTTTTAQPQPPQTSTSQLITITLHYQTATFTFLLPSPNLILTKSTSTQTRHFLTFLSDKFSISTSALKLPSVLLTQSLETYITSLILNSHPDHDRTDPLYAEKRASLLRYAIGTLKLTVSFTGPVSPHLRNLEMAVPCETVDVLLGEAERSQTGTRGFIHVLAEHLHLQTGLKIPLTGQVGDEEGEGGGGSSINGNSNSDELGSDARAGSTMSAAGSEGFMGAPLRLSKITCAAFAVSVEGRLRFASKAIENAGDMEDVVVDANIGLLGGIVSEAIHRSTA